VPRRILRAVRLAVSLFAIVGVTLVLSVLTVFNGYCGDSVAAADEELCHFDVGRQATTLTLGFAGIAALALAGASGFAPLALRRRRLAVALGAAACLAAPWVALGWAIRIEVEHGRDQFGGRLPASVDRLWLASAVIALLTPLVVWLLAGASRLTMRLISYAAAASGASWLLALSCVVWFHDRSS
jgi:hypothetical protein